VASAPLADEGGVSGTRDQYAKAQAPTSGSVDDRLYLFEAVGLLLGELRWRPAAGGGGRSAPGRCVGAAGLAEARQRQRQRRAVCSHLVWGPQQPLVLPFGSS
jgi:hypothetical protein